MRAILVLAFAMLSTSVFAAKGDLVCFGTEPFWGLQITEKTIAFRYADDRAPIVSEIANRETPRGVTPAYAFEVTGENGMRASVVRTGNCSDGMSDNVYAFTVMLRAGDLLTGCCRVEGESRKEP